jgi:hypothetical protein
MWLQGIGLLEQSPLSCGFEPTSDIREMDLLDTARWMEDAIEELEGDIS